jgi:hypothetical protein
MSHSLNWHDVHAMFRQLGQVDEETNGNLKVTRNGHTLVLHPPRAKDVSAPDEIMSLRHFLERSEVTPVNKETKEGHWLLVIDHHEARVFQSTEQGAIPRRFPSRGKDDIIRRAPNAMESSRGKEKSDRNSFFKPVAEALAGAEQILVFGTGTGASNEMSQFIQWAESHQLSLSERIVGSLVVDEHHLTEGQLLAKAREFYVKADQH